MSSTPDREAPEVEAEIVSDGHAGPTHAHQAPTGGEGFRFPKLPFGLTPLTAGGGALAFAALIGVGVWGAQRSATKVAPPSDVAAVADDFTKALSGAPTASTGSAKISGEANALQSDAKDALAQFSAEDQGDAIDLSTGGSLHTPPSFNPSTNDIPSGEIGATAPVAANGSKISNDLASIKDAFQAETQSLSRALAQERVTSQQHAAEIADLKDRLAKIEAGAAAPGGGRQAAASLALISLQRVAASGAPYKTELDILARLLDPGAPAVERIRAFQDEGAPTIAHLKDRFGETARRALAAESSANAQTPAGSIGARIQSLVSVRPASPRAGTSARAAISRAEDHMDRQALAPAVREVEGLSGAAGEAFAAWLADARARLTLDAAIDEINGALLRDVGQ